MYETADGGRNREAIVARSLAMADARADAIERRLKGHLSAAERDALVAEARSLVNTVSTLGKVGCGAGDDETSRKRRLRSLLLAELAETR